MINSESTSWNSVVTDALFYPHEADVIKSLPLSSRVPQDELIWAMSPNGSFSVCRAYTLVVKCSSRFGAFGEKCGASLYHTRSDTWFGDLVEIFCL